MNINKNKHKHNDKKFTRIVIDINTGQKRYE